MFKELESFYQHLELEFSKQIMNLQKDFKDIDGIWENCLSEYKKTNGTNEPKFLLVAESSNTVVDYVLSDSRIFKLLIDKKATLLDLYPCPIRFLDAIYGSNSKFDICWEYVKSKLDKINLSKEVQVIVMYKGLLEKLEKFTQFKDYIINKNIKWGIQNSWEQSDWKKIYRYGQDGLKARIINYFS